MSEIGEENKTLVHDKLHSKLLVPWEIAVQGKEAVIEWITNEQAKYRFRPGESVAHKEWLTKEMFVDEILKEYYSIPDGYSEGKRLYKKVQRMIGISVHYFEDKNAKT